MRQNRPLGCSGCSEFMLGMRSCLPCHIPDRWSRNANRIWPDLAFGFVHKRSGNEIIVWFDLLFAFGMLSCRILDSAFLFIYVHEHDRLCFPMLTVETAVFDCICWLSSSRDRKGQSYPVEYCLESVQEYSEGTIHKGEPEPRKGNVNTVYFINHARGNTRISPTEFIYDESMRLQMV